MKNRISKIFGKFIPYMIFLALIPVSVIYSLILRLIVIAKKAFPNKP